MDTAQAWRPLDRQSLRSIPAELRSWLCDKKSLTQRLVARCGGEFRVEVLSQGWERPRLDECAPLDLAARQWALVRQVRLYCGDAAWVFARTVIPAATLTGPRRRLAHLGTKPLGAFLFAQRSVRRGMTQVIAVSSGDPRTGVAPQPKRAAPTTRVWGRRSVFWLAGSPLLVSEFFLPDMGLTDESRRRDR